MTNFVGRIFNIMIGCNVRTPLPSPLPTVWGEGIGNRLADFGLDFIAEE
jgi:hypothetical protein